MEFYKLAEIFTVIILSSGIITFEIFIIFVLAIVLRRKNFIINENEVYIKHYKKLTCDLRDENRSLRKKLSTISVDKTH